jgi:hemerythrin-like domain-containing protein
MLVEHDMGRFHMAELKKALEELKKGNEEAKIDIIASAVGYANLLYRHIDKEDNVVYRFAERELSKETLEEVNLQCQEFEAKQAELDIQNKYIALVEELEKKYA